MDVQDAEAEFKEAFLNNIGPTVDAALELYFFNFCLTTQTRHILLVAYIVFILVKIKSDVRQSIVRALSLVPLWFGFYHNRDFSLMAIRGTYLITKMALMMFGNASIWMTVPGAQSHARPIVLGGAELVTFLFSWTVLVLAGWVVGYCTRPFHKLPALPKAIIATIFVQAIVVILNKRASPITQRVRQPESVAGAEQTFDADVHNNTASMYKQDEELSSGKVIRLVRLLPQNRGEEIRCEMVTRDLDRAGDYEAVSYTWGDDKRQATIEMDGRPIRISHKISGIFQVLRHAWKPRMLWIDSVCINQVDAGEKSHQITLMRHIYHRAISVIVWLDPLPDTPVAIDLLLEISRSRGLTGTQGAHLYGQREQRDRLLALARFLGNNYFSRLWVVQEIASARAIQVMCGDLLISWEDLCLVLSFMENLEMLRFLQRTEEMDVVACDQDSLRHAGAILTTKASTSRGVSFSLAFVLGNYRSFQCKDPRDKVFGVLGLVRNTDHPLIRPDYRKDEVQVFKDAAKYVFMIEDTSRKLFALPFAGVGHCRRLQELPSWVPDWATNMRRKRTERENDIQEDDLSTHNQSKFSYLVQPLSNYGNGNDTMKPDQSYFETSSIAFGYHAALDSKAELELAGDDVLGVRGFVVDEIRDLTSVFDIPFDGEMRVSHTAMTLATFAWFEEAEALAANASSPYPTGQSVEDIVWRTMTGDRILGMKESQVVRPAPSDYGEIYQQHKAASLHLRRACSVLPMDIISEMRDIFLQIFNQIIVNGPVFKVLVEVVCGRSGHPNVWQLITTGTKFAINGTPPPDFPDVPGDAQFWQERLEELSENEETKDLVAVLIKLFEVFSTQNPSNALEIDASEKVAEAAKLGRLVPQFYEALRTSFERRLCITKNGYIGLVPPLTRAGDLVSILHGGDTPYLVRPETNLEVGKKIGVLRCRLVGECYMHGMMDGEMMGPENAPLWFHLT